MSQFVKTNVLALQSSGITRKSQRKMDISSDTKQEEPESPRHGTKDNEGETKPQTIMSQAAASPSPQQGMYTDSDIASMLATTMSMIAHVLERQAGPVHVTTGPDLTSTLPTYDGTDNNLQEWIAAVESMRDLSSWSEAATLSAAITRLRGRAMEWQKTDGIAHKKWDEWVAALENEFDRPLLFCQWIAQVNNRRQQPNESIVDYMYSRLELIRRGHYDLSNEDIVDWLIQGVSNAAEKPILAAYYDLRQGTLSEFLQYASQIERQGQYNRGHNKSTAVQNGAPRFQQQTPNTVPSHKSPPAPQVPETTVKLGKIPSDTCARCLKTGHRARQCDQPDTRTPEQKAAATRRWQQRTDRTTPPKHITSEKHVNKVVTAHPSSRQNVIVLPATVNGIATEVMWDTGSATTLLSEDFASCHNFHIVPDNETVLRGPFGNTSQPLGVTQALISIGCATATVQACVSREIPHSVIIGLDWRKAIPFDYVERCNENSFSVEWIPKADFTKKESVALAVAHTNLIEVFKRPPGVPTTNDETLPHMYMSCGTVSMSPGSIKIEQDSRQLPTPNEAEHLVTHLKNASNATTEQFEAMKDVLRRNSSVFTKPDDDLGQCTTVQHEIELNDDKPVRMQPYSATETNRQFIEKEINDWLHRGIIRHSTSSYASPVIVVDQPHHDSTPKRLCIDYRFLNAKTVQRAYPMPRIDSILRKTSGAQFFSKLDIKKAFLNVPIKETDIHKAAFVTESGHYEPLRMPFGLTTAPATMQNIMNEGLRELVETGHVAVYMDDVCIFTSNTRDHVKLLDRTLKNILNIGLRIDINKCIFMSKSIPFLGLILSQDGIAIDPARTAAVNNYDEVHQGFRQDR
ncbi:uncharacterized protein LOC135390930 [Ornithodoros turicata]|uniref:uncharacterized protein LOC135390930 n=1 Tax=Ornithodoros turicata TaxID=34597 RepID=UPI00313950C2